MNIGGFTIIKTSNEKPQLKSKNYPPDKNTLALPNTKNEITLDSWQLTRRLWGANDKWRSDPSVSITALRPRLCSASQRAAGSWELLGFASHVPCRGYLLVVSQQIVFFSVVFVVFFEVPDWGIRTHDSIVFCFVGIHTATVHIYVLFVAVVVVVSLFSWQTQCDWELLYLFIIFLFRAWHTDIATDQFHCRFLFSLFRFLVSGTESLASCHQCYVTGSLLREFSKA